MAPNAYNLTVYDQSSTIVYSPFRDGPLDSGWRVYYSSSSDATYDETHATENLSSGTSTHSTILEGANLQIDFMGTAVYLYGSGSAGAYTTTLDGGDAEDGNPDDGVLASYTGLDFKAHTIVLTTTSNSQLNFTQAVLTIGVGEAGATISNNRTNAVDVAADGSTTLNSAFTTQGNGPFSTDHNAQGYSRVDTTGDGSKVIFEFNSASTILVYGTMNYDHDVYSVSLNPSAGISTKSRTFNATSRWFAYDVLIYWETDLDQDTTYQLTLQNEANGKYMDVHSVTLMEAKSASSSTSESSATNTSIISDSSRGSTLTTGAIAGIAIAGVVAIAVVFILLFWRRRHLKKKQRQEPHFGLYDTSYQIDPFSASEMAPRQPSYTEPLLSGYVEPFTASSTDRGTLSAAASKYHLDTPGRASTYSLDTSSHSTLPAGAAGPRVTYHLSEDGMRAISDPGSSSSGSGMNKGSASSPRPYQRVVRQETDAGPLPLPDQPDTEEVLPPGYNPAWVAGSSSR